MSLPYLKLEASEELPRELHLSRINVNVVALVYPPNHNYSQGSLAFASCELKNSYLHKGPDGWCLWLEHASMNLTEDEAQRVREWLPSLRVDDKTKEAA